MKKIILLFALFVSFIACSSDDDKNVSDQDQPQLPVTVENLTGTWLAVEYRGSNGNGTELGPFNPIPESSRYTINFKSDLSVIVETFQTCEGVYQLDQQAKLITLSLMNCQAMQATSKIASLTENELILESQSSIEVGIRKYKKQN